MKAFNLNILDGNDESSSNSSPSHIEDHLSSLKMINGSLIALNSDISNIFEDIKAVNHVKDLSQFKKQHQSLISQYSKELTEVIEKYEAKSNDTPILQKLFKHLQTLLFLLKEENGKVLGKTLSKKKVIQMELKQQLQDEEETKSWTELLEIISFFCQKVNQQKSLINNRGKTFMVSQRLKTVESVEAKLENSERQLIELKKQLLAASSMSEFKQLEEQLFRAQSDMLKYLKRLQRKPKKKK